MAKNVIQKKKRVAKIKNLLDDDMVQGDCFDYVSRIKKDMDSNFLSVQSNYFNSSKSRIAGLPESNKEVTDVNTPSTSKNSVKSVNPVLKPRKFGLARKFPLMEKSQKILKHLRHNQRIPKPRAHMASAVRSPLKRFDHGSPGLSIETKNKSKQNISENKSKQNISENKNKQISENKGKQNIGNKSEQSSENKSKQISENKNKQNSENKNKQNIENKNKQSSENKNKKIIEKEKTACNLNCDIDLFCNSNEDLNLRECKNFYKNEKNGIKSKESIANGNKDDINDHMNLENDINNETTDSEYERFVKSNKKTVKKSKKRKTSAKIKSEKPPHKKVRKNTTSSKMPKLSSTESSDDVSSLDDKIPKKKEQEVKPSSNVKTRCKAFPCESESSDETSSLVDKIPKRKKQAVKSNSKVRTRCKTFPCESESSDEASSLCDKKQKKKLVVDSNSKIKTRCRIFPRESESSDEVLSLNDKNQKEKQGLGSNSDVETKCRTDSESDMLNDEIFTRDTSSESDVENDENVKTSFDSHLVQQMNGDACLPSELQLAYHDENANDCYSEPVSKCSDAKNDLLESENNCEQSDKSSGGSVILEMPAGNSSSKKSVPCDFSVLPLPKEKDRCQQITNAVQNASQSEESDLEIIDIVIPELKKCKIEIDRAANKPSCIENSTVHILSESDRSTKMREVSENPISRRLSECNATTHESRFPENSTARRLSESDKSTNKLSFFESSDKYESRNEDSCGIKILEVASLAQDETNYNQYQPKIKEERKKNDDDRCDAVYVTNMCNEFDKEIYSKANVLEEMNSNRASNKMPTISENSFTSQKDLITDIKQEDSDDDIVIINCIEKLPSSSTTLPRSSVGSKITSVKTENTKSEEQSTESSKIKTEVLIDLDSSNSNPSISCNSSETLRKNENVLSKDFKLYEVACSNLARAKSKQPKEDNIKKLLDLYKQEFQVYQDIVQTEATVEAKLKRLESHQAEKLKGIRSLIHHFVEEKQPVSEDNKSGVKEQINLMYSLQEIRHIASSGGKTVVPAQVPGSSSQVDLDFKKLGSPKLESSSVEPLSTYSVPAQASLLPSVVDRDVKPDLSVLHNLSLSNQIHPQVKQEMAEASEANTKMLLGEKCNACGKDAIAACQQCARVFFCSDECGMTYWNNGHRNECGKRY